MHQTSQKDEHVKYIAGVNLRLVASWTQIHNMYSMKDLHKEIREFFKSSIQNSTHKKEPAQPIIVHSIYILHV